MTEADAIALTLCNLAGFGIWMILAGLFGVQRGGYRGVGRHCPSCGAWTFSTPCGVCAK